MSFSHIASQGVDGKNPGKYSREPCWQGLAGLAGATTGMGDRNELGELSDSPLSIFFPPLARRGYSLGHLPTPVSLSINKNKTLPCPTPMRLLPKCPGKPKSGSGHLTNRFPGCYCPYVLAELYLSMKSGFKQHSGYTPGHGWGVPGTLLTRWERMVLAPVEVKDGLSVVVLWGSWLRCKDFQRRP